MATTKVSQLTAKTSLSGSEELLINDGGASKKVTATNLLAGAAVADGSISTAKLAADAVTNAKIANDSIDSEHYVDGSIDTAHIADNAITSAKLGVDVIVAEDIANNAITVAELADNAVTTAKLNADAVTGAKIADDAIDSEHYTDGSIDTAHIADDAVTADKLANSINTEIAANTAKVGITTSQANAITANTAKVTNATHTGEVTGATALTIADDVVDEANLKVSNSPTNGYFLSAQSGNTGGLTWAEVDALPSQSSNSGKYLTTDGSSASWATLATGNTTANGMWEMAHTISSNYSITSGNNAITAGPITINSGVSVTVPTGSTWVVA